MVTGTGGALTTVELLFINGTRLCFLPNLPTALRSYSQNGLITCGGNDKDLTRNYKSCVTFSAGRWKKTHTLRQRRYGHTAYALPQGVMLIGGDAHGGFKKTTELLTDNGGATLSINLFNERV